MATHGEADESRVPATAQHIVKSGHSTQDALRIFCSFDGTISATHMPGGLERPNSDSSHRQEHRREVKETSVAVSPQPDERHEALCRILHMAGDTVLKWEMASSHSTVKAKVWEAKESSSAYLAAVDKLQDLMSLLAISRQARPVVDRARNLLQVAMVRLEDEFRHLLVDHSTAIQLEWVLELMAQGAENDFADAASHSSMENGEEEQIDPPIHQSPNFVIDLLPSNVTLDLNDIACRMMVGGHGRQCSKIYASFRKAVLEQNIHRLGSDKISIQDIHKMTWENLEVRIKKWIQTLKVSVRVLYGSERVLCDRVFDGLSPLRETTFLELAKGSMMQLLSLGESIAISKRSPEKLFKILDMYETLSELLPDINVVFSDDLCGGIRSEANGILLRLGQAARGTFTEFENAIQRDASRIPVPGAAVHPLTRYVMNYIWFLFCYAGTLKHLLGEKKISISRIGGDNNLWDSNESEVENCCSALDNLSPLAVQIIWLTVLLECNLDGKSQLYQDVSQSYLFLMNNAHYILQKVEQSELASLFGEDWIKKHTDQVWQYATNYVRTAWSRVLGYLRDEGLATTGPFCSGISKAVLKEKIKAFNASFEEAHRTQSTWVVPDLQLREKLRQSISEKLIPAYRSFMSHYESYLESGRHQAKYITYSLEDLDNCLLHLFEGGAPFGQGIWMSFSVS